MNLLIPKEEVLRLLAETKEMNLKAREITDYIESSRIGFIIDGRLQVLTEIMEILQKTNK